jgi:hypothetical protein
MTNLFSHFRLLKKYPVGVCIPPSYMEPRMRDYMIKPLRVAEKIFGSIPALADFGDHIYLSFCKP